MKCDDCTKCSQNVGWVGFWSTLGLGLFKLYIGIISGSRALIASSFCSLTDIASATSIIASNKVIRKPDNGNYPYGYGKIEFIVTMLVSLCILLSTFFILVTSFYLIVKRVHIIPRWIAFFAAVLSSILSWVKYKYSNCVAHETNSPAVRAHADHNKTDYITSTCVAASVIFSRFGLGFMDPLVAIFETVHIIHATAVVFTRGAKGLLDASVDHEKILKIENASTEVEGVKNVETLRARQSGQGIFVDISVLLQNNINVAEASIIKEKIKQNIHEFLPQTKNVLVRMRA